MPEIPQPGDRPPITVQLRLAFPAALLEIVARESVRRGESLEELILRVLQERADAADDLR